MLPTFIVVSGPPGGYGKTTLAHEIARAVGCPAICRDEIKEGMVHASPPRAEPGPAGPHPSVDPLTQDTFTVFFDVLALLLSSGVTVVAEAAFQGPKWQPELECLAELAEIRIIRCMVDPAMANERNARRAAQNPRRALAHPPTPKRRYPQPYQPIAIGAPSITVDTTNGYDPSLADIVAFVGPPLVVAADRRFQGSPNSWSHSPGYRTGRTITDRRTTLT